MRVLHTVLSLGLNLVIERLRANPRLRYTLIALLVVNELFGAWRARQLWEIVS